PARQEQAEQNQHDRQRIEPYQHRYGDPDQAVEPLVGYGHAEDGEDPDHLRITEWELPTEESATGRYQAHRGGQARQGDDYCQQQAASSAEAVLDKGCEDLAAVGTGLDQRAAGGAQLEQGEINQGKADRGDDRGNDGVTGDDMGFLHLAVADRPGDHHAEHQGA